MKQKFCKSHIALVNERKNGNLMLKGKLIFKIVKKKIKTKKNDVRLVN